MALLFHHFCSNTDIFHPWISAYADINLISAGYGWYILSLLISLCAVLEKLHIIILLTQRILVSNSSISPRCVGECFLADIGSEQPYLMYFSVYQNVSTFLVFLFSFSRIIPDGASPDVHGRISISKRSGSEDTYQTAHFGRRRVVSVFQQAAALHADGISVVAMDTGTTGSLGRWAQAPLHPHHLVVGTHAAAQIGWRREINQTGRRREDLFKRDGSKDNQSLKMELAAQIFRAKTE